MAGTGHSSNGNQHYYATKNSSLFYPLTMKVRQYVKLSVSTKTTKKLPPVPKDMFSSTFNYAYSNAHSVDILKISSCDLVSKLSVYLGIHYLCQALAVSCLIATDSDFMFFKAVWLMNGL